MAKQKLRQAKCITLSISGKGNHIFRNSDEKPFNENQVLNFDALLKEKAIKLVEDEKPKKDKK